MSGPQGAPELGKVGVPLANTPTEATASQQLRGRGNSGQLALGFPTTMMAADVWGLWGGEHKLLQGTSMQVTAVAWWVAAAGGSVNRNGMTKACPGSGSHGATAAVARVASSLCQARPLEQEAEGTAASSSS